VNPSARYRFGEFTLIPALRELARNGRPLAVQPRVFDTLAYLIQHRDRAVGRDELIAAVWGTVDITDNVLSQIVARARQAVGDSAEVQHTLRTVPRFGYRWVGGVDAASATAVPAPVEPPVATPRRWQRPAVALTLLCALGVLVRSSSQAPPIQPSLPMATIAPDSATERVAAVRAALAASQFDAARILLRDLPEADRLRPDVRYEEALLALSEGHVDGALTALRTLIADLGDAPANALLAGKAHYAAGQAESRRRDGDAAQRHYEAAIAQLAGQPAREAAIVLGRAWTSLGSLRLAQRQSDDAEHAYAQARTALEGTGDAAALGQWENTVGAWLLSRYQDADALPHFRRAIALAATAGQPNQEARAHMNVTNLLLQNLQPAEALASVVRLGELRERVGDPMLAAHIDLIRAKVLVANGHLADAEQLLRTNAGRPVAADPALTSLRDMIAAELAFARGALNQGAPHVRALLASPAYTADDGMAAYARWRLLVAQSALGDQSGMVATASAAEAQSRQEPGEPTIRVYALLARGEAAAEKGDLAAARRHFGQALDQAEATRVPFDVVQVAERYARFLLRVRAYDEAAKIADRLAGWADHEYTASLVQLTIYHAIGSEAWRWALVRTQRLAGERPLPAPLSLRPTADGDPAKNGNPVLLAGGLP
jgi:DNA-binding winged helix-turn-helix (wHTH) protein/tetratricopeptide (TPR) repeat protein